MEAAQRREREAREDARNALLGRQRAERAAREAERKAEEDMEVMRRSERSQPLYSMAYDDTCSPPMGYHPRPVPRSRSMEYGWCPMPSSMGGLTFYKGGQFIPGGGRAPAGGIWM